MVDSNILYELRDGIGYITISGANPLNILTRETIKELADILTRWKQESNCRVIIITGAGDRAFSAGVDVNIFLEVAKEPLGGTEWSRHGQNAFGVLAHLGKPSIAAVNGIALGGGCELVLACTLRVVSQQARFGLPEITLGLIPGWGATQRLARLVGESKAMEVILTGEMIDAVEAHRIGLVNRVVAPEELMSTCEAVAQKIIQNGPLAVRLAMEAVHQGLDLPLQEGLLLESDLAGFSCITEDAQEGLRSFLEKRKPIFKGR